MNSKKILEFIEYRALFREACAIEQQRQRNDRFYMTINLILITALATVIFKPFSLNPLLMFGSAVIGVLTCVRWWMKTHYHRKKYKTVETQLLQLEASKPVRIKTALRQLHKYKGKDMREGMFTQCWVIGVFMIIQIALLIVYCERTLLAKSHILMLFHWF